MKPLLSFQSVSQGAACFSHILQASSHLPASSCFSVEVGYSEETGGIPSPDLSNHAQKETDQSHPEVRETALEFHNLAHLVAFQMN